jgi:hypothetical protein
VSYLPIQSAGSRLGASKLDRHVGRELAGAKAYGQVLTARETAKIEALANVTESGMLAVTHISAMESLLITQCPLAERRLKAVADAGTVGIASVVMGMSRWMS